MLKRAVLAGLAVAILFLIGTVVISRDRLTDPVTYVIAAGLVLVAGAFRYAWARNTTRTSAA